MSVQRWPSALHSIDLREVGVRVASENLQASYEKKGMKKEESRSVQVSSSGESARLTPAIDLLSPEGRRLSLLDPSERRECRLEAPVRQKGIERVWNLMSKG